jgi:hypothetical protein
MAEVVPEGELRKVERQVVGADIVEDADKAAAWRGNEIGGRTAYATGVRVGPALAVKTVMALFADIKGSMELIEDLDPERRARLSIRRLADSVGAEGAHDNCWVRSLSGQRPASLTQDPADTAEASTAFAPRSTSRAAKGARLYELRATIETRPVPSEIHGWFHGFDTAGEQVVDAATG